MKAFITPAYTFTPGATGVGIIDFSGIVDFDIKRLIAVINQTKGRVLYSTASPTTKYTDVSGSTITLFEDTTEMSALDSLQVIYEIPDTFATSTKQDEAVTALGSLATETTLTAIAALDFATETTLTSLDSKDFATEATLVEIRDSLAGPLVPSYQEIVNLTNSVQTFTAPANAKWCKIMTEDTNSANIRVKIGGTATISSGMQFQPGRSEDYRIAGNISVIAESGTSQKISVQFGA